MRKRSLAVQPEGGEAATQEPTSYVNAVWVGSQVRLLWRDELGRLKRRDVPAEHCCHLRASDWTPDLEREMRSSPNIVGYKREGDWYRVQFRERDVCRDLCGPRGWFELKGIPTFEADLHPVRRWLVEHPDVQIQRPRRALVDVENDSRVSFENKEEARLLVIGVYFCETGRFWQGVLDEDTDEAEARLLADFWEQLEEVDQVAVWAGSSHTYQRGRKPGTGIFDVDVLFARTAYHRDSLRVEPRRWLWISHLDVYAKLNMSAAGSGEEKQSLALDAVARSLGIEGKEDFDASQTWEAWLEGGEQLDKLCSYNERDVRVMADIEAKKPYLDLITSVCIACGIFPDHRGMNGTAYVESFILRLSSRRNFHWRSHWGWKPSERFEGAFVLEPRQLGLLRDVHVCDFASLYPSIIQTFNLSPETHAPEHKQFKQEARPSYLAHAPIVEQPLPPGYCRAPRTGEAFRTDVVGMLPLAVTELRRLRKFHSDEQERHPVGTKEHEHAKNLSAGFKICVNTFYGVAGSPFSRFFERAVAESTSTTGAWLIKDIVMVEAQARGMTVQAGDTDSAFITGCSQQQFQSFVEWLNEMRIPEAIRSRGCQVNEIRLEAEKGFDVLVTVAKKRYAGRFAYYKGKAASAAKSEIKGLEYKRGDSVRLAREMQKEVIERLLCLDQHPAPKQLPYTVEDFKQLVERWRLHVTKGDIEPSDYIISKSLGKPLAGYRAAAKKDGSEGSLPAHVAVAHRMKAAGMNVSEGTRIQYVVVDGEASPQRCAGLWEFRPGDEDRHYLWETQVWQPTFRVLEACFPEFDWKVYNRSRPYRGRAPKYGGAGDGQRGLPGVVDDIPAAKAASR